MKRPTCKIVMAGVWTAARFPTVVANGILHVPGDAGGLALSHQACHRPFPSFLWAGSQAGEQSEIGYQHDSRDVQDLASILVESESVARSVDVAILVLSTGSSFSTSGVSDANALAQAKGTVASPLHCRSATATFPYTYPSSTAISEALPLLATVTGSPVHKMSLGDVESTISGNSMLTDGKLDLVVVTVPEAASVEETDAAVRGLTAMLEKESNGRFLLMWTGDFHGEECGRRTLFDETRRARSALANSRRRLTEVTLTPRTILITPDILAGVLVGVLFVFILSVGYGCVGEIECPQSFPKANPAKGKEY